MPLNSTIVNNLGQYGVMPDVSVTSLPPNAFTFARNWRFNEGDFAEVSEGYTNALDTRNIQQLGLENSNGTFLYTWLLDTRNSFFYYDSANSQMRYVENNSLQELVDNNLSVLGDQYQDTLNYSASGTLAAGEFRISSTALMIRPSSGVMAATVNAAFRSGATIEFFQDARLISTVDFAGTIAESSGVWTITQGGLPQFFSDETGIEVRVSVPRGHDIQSNFSWSATTALGVPIFSNPDEHPYIFQDDNIASIQPLTNFPNGGTAQFFTSYSSQLVAIGYQNRSDTAGFRGNNRTIAFSDVFAPGTVPTWDFGGRDYTDVNGESVTGATSRGGATFSQIFDLSLYTEGELVSAYEYNGALYVNSTTDVIVMSDAGNGEFNATILPLGSGVIVQGGSTPIPNGFFNIGNGRMYTHDGSSFTPVGDGVWTDSWFQSVDDERLDEVQCVYDPRSTSVWIKTPVSDTRQEMWIYNLVTGSLSILDDHQEIQYLTFSPDGVPARSTTWDTITGTWDELPQNSWNEFPILALGEFRNRILSIGGREVFVHDFGPTYNARAINATLRKEYFRTPQYSYGTFDINTVIPWAEGRDQDSLMIRVGQARTTNDDTVWTPFVNYTLGTSEKADFRVNATWGGVEFVSTVSGTRLTGYQIDLYTSSKTGRR